jgi:cytochrome c556
MTNSLIIEKAIDEIEAKTFGLTEQFLQIHKIVYADNKPKIARIDTDKENEAIIYFNVENEKFFLAVYIDTKPNISVRWTNTEPYHSVYFRASSETLSLTELAKLTKLTSTGGRNKGDKRRPGSTSEIVWKHSTIDFEPNPEADEFEDKLSKLLDFSEQDKEGVENLINKADYSCIHVYSSFHNGNPLLDGHHVEKDQIKRISKLNLEIDFDISADGNFFT